MKNLSEQMTNSHL